jgi:hypothetical protein
MLLLISGIADRFFTHASISCSSIVAIAVIAAIAATSRYVIQPFYTHASVLSGLLHPRAHMRAHTHATPAGRHARARAQFDARSFHASRAQCECVCVCARAFVVQPSPSAVAGTARSHAHSHTKTRTRAHECTSAHTDAHARACASYAIVRARVGVGRGRDALTTFGEYCRAIVTFRKYLPRDTSRSGPTAPWYPCDACPCSVRRNHCTPKPRPPQKEKRPRSTVTARIVQAAHRGKAIFGERAMKQQLRY